MYEDMNYTVDKCAEIVEELYQSGTIQGVVDILEHTISTYEETMIFQ